MNEAWMNGGMDLWMDGWMDFISIYNHTLCIAYCTICDVTNDKKTSHIATLNYYSAILQCETQPNNKYIQSTNHPIIMEGVDGWMRHEWMEGWIDEWMDGWTLAVIVIVIYYFALGSNCN